MKSGLVKSLTRPKVKTRTLEPIIVRLPPPPVTSNSKMAKNQAGLSTKELETFRDLLLQKRRELLGDMSSMEGDALRSGNTNLSTLPLHMADSGTDNYEQEFTLNLVEKERKLLGEIQRALAKIQDGSYGVCEGTGKPIGKPRLEAQPWAKYSIEHARALEKPQYRRAY
ncbi:MAG TPA: TraR/DksA C4-type zinc finger protein [Tepidisphaeraceae bacterium]|jgi:RNA polymerase-binding protein DksA